MAAKNMSKNGSVMIHDFKHGYACFVELTNNGNDGRYKMIMADGKSYVFDRCEETPCEFCGVGVPIMPGYDFRFWIMRNDLILSVYKRSDRSV